MSINFAAASTAGLNNPGTEIITLVKDVSGNFINPPSYDKIRAYLRSGDVPCLFVTDAAATTGDIYQLSGYSETANKIRFSNDTTAIEFCAGCGTPVVSEIGGGGSTGIGFDVVITMNTTDGSYSLASGNYSDIKNKLLALQPVLCTAQYNSSSSAASSRIMAEVYYVYAEECIYCEEAGVGGTKYKIHPDNTVTSV